MQIRQLRIEGAFEMTPQVHGDRRGAFLEWFRADRFLEATGHDLTLAQANFSVSAAGTVRGIHFADVPPGQAKYITCPVGALMDVVVDIRVGSPTFGEWDAVLLDDENRNAVYVGEGLGHGFMALADGSVSLYLCSTPYAPEREHGVHPHDPELGIAWPTTDRAGRALEPILSERDRAMPRLLEARDAGQLPAYDSVRSFVASLS